MVFETNLHQRSEHRRTHRRRETLSTRVKHLETTLKEEKPELKFYDQAAYAATVVTSAGLVISLDGPIPSGTGQSQRTGVQVREHTSLWKLGIAVNTTAVVNYFRMILFTWKDTIAANYPTVSTVLQTAGWQYPYNNDYKKNFIVHHDKLYSLAVGSDQLIVDECLMDLRGIVTQWDADTTTDNPIHNALYVLFISDQSTNGPTMTFHHRLKYMDS